MTGEKHRQIMQNSGIFTRRNFMTGLYAVICVQKVKVYLIWGLERAFFQEICTDMEQNGQVRIYLKIKLNRQKRFQRAWI